MKHTLKKLDKSQIELNITVEPKEYEIHMRAAATRISIRTATKGFRKGKAPYDVIKREYGEMNILNEALEKIIHETFYKAITEEKLETIGMPDVKIEKVAPGNPLVYTATVALLPKIKLADLSKIKVTKKVKEVDEKQMQEVLENLAKMQAKEIIKPGKATKEDKVVIDMELYVDKVVVEGGTAKDYQVYLSEDHYIPGFADELVGTKKDDEKEFTLPFPKTYFQKNLAGKQGTFKIKVKDVYERTFPEINDDFAKLLGQKSLEELKKILKKNLIVEEEKKAEEKLEIEIFDTLIEKTEFEEIPDVLIDAERKKMFYELQRDIERNGMTISQYLDSIKKKEEDLHKDFTDQATKRAKAALVSRQVAKDQNVKVEDKELEKEIKMMEDVYKDNPEYLENLKKPEVKDSIRNMLANKKVVTWLKEQVVGEKTKTK